jgi:hypothetical protein
VRRSVCSMMAAPSGEANWRLVKKSRWPSGLWPAFGIPASVSEQSGTRNKVSRPSGGRAAHHARGFGEACVTGVRIGRSSASRTKQCSVHGFISAAVSASMRKNAGIADMYATFSAAVRGITPSQAILRTHPPPSDQ